MAEDRTKLISNVVDFPGSSGGQVMKVTSRLISLKSTEAPQFINITDHVSESVALAGLSTGFVVIFTRHTTAAVKINESEPLLLEDMKDFLNKIAPKGDYYRHNDFTIRTVNMTEDECPNGHSHCQHLLMGSSEMIPVVDGQLQLGQWQSVFLVELDRPRDREVHIQVFGI